MLTADTKRHIDSARQVLVGKIPNPIGQVQEITKALIYKFMDDMDEQAAALGGKRRYFVGDYQKYSWRTIMSPQVGAQDRIDLYQEALKKMTVNPGIPVLFQQIFRNAHLPYNDGRTLTLFLTEINYFDYKHSEELGNAYEYLLSIMGSQGDAGQFRTPRHIIDFIVSAVVPTKNDKVLDPACGTAGFLISAYKHVLAKHDGKDNITGKNTNAETPLTADEKHKLYSNYTGFDIDDEMVKLSQVNMFLHGFISPNILVHDSLSSEDYWHDRYDVILANPPFMTPKGGIVPHNKFGVQSNRAEVLFVDYIMNHLKPSGRAGVIVPEGIIFQSGTAYKQLRKNLVEDGLYAVVSLPSGVFNPYAGVKTSILLFNNELAKQKDEIVFIKVQKDGFDLGAQRREAVANDLPTALDILAKWKTGTKVEADMALYVEKTKIAESGDYNLSGDRYRVTTDYSNAKWPMVELGEVSEILNGYAFRSEKYTNKGIRVIRITNVQKGSIVDDNPKFYDLSSSKEIQKYLLAKDDLLISLTGNVGRVGLLQYELLPAGLNQRVGCIRLKDNKQVSINYLFHVLNTDLFEGNCIRASSGVAQKNLSTEWLKKYEIPLPPLEIQEQIVAELDGYANIIAGAKQITQNWKPQITIDPEWPKVQLDEILDYEQPTKYIVNSVEYSNDYKIPVLTAGKSFILGYTDEQDGIYSDELPVIIFDDFTTASKLVDFKFKVKSSAMKILHSKNKVANITFVHTMMQNIKFNSSTHKRYWISEYSKLEIPLPDIKTQNQIVAKIEAERALVNPAQKLIDIYEQKTKAVIAKLWH